MSLNHSFRLSLLFILVLFGQLIGIYPECKQALAQLPTATEGKITERHTEANRLTKEGFQQHNSRKFSEALANFQKALIIWREIGDRQGEAVGLYNIGVTYKYLNDDSQALEAYHQALAISKELGRLSIEGRIINNIGDIYNNQREYEKALDYYQQALAMHEKMGNHLEAAETLYNIGASYKASGKYQNALSFLQQALVTAQSVKNEKLKGIILNLIGTNYHLTGEYQKAIESYQQALVFHKKLNNSPQEAKTLSNLAENYRIIGQDKKALESLQQSLDIAEKYGDSELLSQSLNNIGLIYQDSGQYPEALEVYEKALAIDKKLDAQASIATTLNNLGSLYLSWKQPDKALEFLQKALDIHQKMGSRVNEAQTRSNIGLIYNIRGQDQEALKFFQQALAIHQKLNDRPNIGITLNNIGVQYLSFGNLIAAEKAFYDAIRAWESLRPGLTDQNKISIFETQQSAYRFLQTTLVAQQKTNQALEVAERGRAKAFIELLTSKLSPDLQNQNPESLQKKFIVNLEQIKQIAQTQNASVVEYSIVSDKDLYIWVVQPTGKIEFRSIDLKKSLDTSLAKLVTSSRESIGVRGRASIEIESVVDAADQKKQLQQLHKLLIDPIADILPKDPNSHVIFIPQGQLFLVPFPALQDADGKYLIEKHTILSAPAIQVLNLTNQQRLKPRPADLQAALVVGNPTMPEVTTKLGDSPQQLSNLPAAEQEAKEIAKLFKTEAFTGKQAIKAKILPKLSQARIIHLATHGLLDDFKGLGVPGAIALAPSGNGELNDGLLTANEILDLKLNADLVVLSACDTGRGQITGDGVIGLSRSLITAGTPSVIVSLWSVPDAPTAELMTEFYRNWQERKLNKAQALRQAMLKTMKQHPNPKDWAAFTLIGEAK
ncbi:CHAT domain-containing tetratricopeptide repeat protein [Nostoc sp. NZL]|uniref:CHAT domain-containing tetratricopeptide repeat protein n=1 Tax=Nostoc sp. NZL TaxID=2650612 RepID=UPI001E45CA32|nr:CHAT domain-containing protein [Nostoc sp. NZL]MBG1240498.1 CHAT domain-containing protein [Nostoc sp. NZL]